jgi:hypothetical protein
VHVYNLDAKVQNCVVADGSDVLVDLNEEAELTFRSSLGSEDWAVLRWDRLTDSTPVTGSRAARSNLHSNWLC